jgi:hypothetical protein
MLNLSNKFVVFHMRPPDSGELFLVKGIAYRHTLQLYLILELAMTFVGGVPALLMNELFTPHSRATDEQMPSPHPQGAGAGGRHRSMTAHALQRLLVFPGQSPGLRHRLLPALGR